VEHTPQSKVLEFLVAHLAGLEYLKDLSHCAHPLDKDQAVARPGVKTVGRIPAASVELCSV